MAFSSLLLSLCRLQTGACTQSLSNGSVGYTGVWHPEDPHTVLVGCANRRIVQVCNESIRNCWFVLISSSTLILNSRLVYHVNGSASQGSSLVADFHFP